MEPSSCDFKFTDKVVVPRTAIEVKVTNVLTPYAIRIYKVNSYAEKLNLINNTLKHLMRQTDILTKNAGKVPQLTDSVIVNIKGAEALNRTVSFFRGKICRFITTTKTYNVLLIDHGIVKELSRDDFIIVPHSLVFDDCLTSSIGIYNILPAGVRDISAGCKSINVLEEWSTMAIEFTKELIGASSTVHFHHLASDEQDRKYGDLYLNIQSKIIRLSEILVQYYYAVALEGDILQLIEDPNYVCEKEIFKNDTIYILSSKQCHKNEDAQNLKRAVDIVKQNNSVLEANASTKTITTCNGYIIETKELLNRQDNKRDKILIYSNSKYNCINDIVDAKFTTKIHRAWDMHVKSSRPKTIQSYILPAIKNGLNVVAIGTSGSGKTYGYSVAVAALLATQQNLPRGKKPSALVLCSSSSEALGIQSLCASFLQGYSNINAVAAFNGKTIRSLAAEIYNGCQIIISTPQFLARTLRKYKDILDFEKLQYLIFDNADIMFDKYNDSVRELLKKHGLINNRNKQDNTSSSLQMIMISRTWTPSLQKMVSLLLTNPFICIASFLEAVIYKSVCPKMYVTNSKYKRQQVLDLLKNHDALTRVMIVCVTTDEAKEIALSLLTHKKVLLAHEDMNILELRGIKECWEASVCGLYPILICTDNVLSELDITNVDWLIHYSVLLNLKMTFNFRFSTLYDNLKKEKCNCKVTIMVDENNDIQFPSIIRTIMMRMKVIIPQNVLQAVERITMKLDQEKSEFQLCDNIKLFGLCPKRNECIFRHCIIPHIDKVDSCIKIGDKVKLMVLYVHDATHFTARIIDYVKSDTSERISLSHKEYMEVSIKMQEYYQDPNNRRRCNTVHVGDVCTLEDPIETFKRVQVLNIKEGNCLMVPKLIDVRCIDTGIILEGISVNKLLFIPDNLLQLASHIIELFLVGIAPYDNEYCWNSCAIEMVHKWFADNVDEKSYVFGTVSLHLNNTLWIDTLEVGTPLIGYPDLIGPSLKAELLKNDHACLNATHITNIYNLCKRGGLEEVNGCNIQSLLNNADTSIKLSTTSPEGLAAPAASHLSLSHAGSHYWANWAVL